MVIKDGRFGPYVTDGVANASLRKGDTVEEMNDDRASELLMIRREKTGKIVKEDGKDVWIPDDKKKAKKSSKKKAVKKLVIARDLQTDIAESPGPVTFMLTDGGTKGKEAMKAAAAALDAVATSVADVKYYRGVATFVAEFANAEAASEQARDIVADTLKSAEVTGRISVKGD